MKLLLASSSPRRRELLRLFSLAFAQIGPEVDEGSLPYLGDPFAFTAELSCRKAKEALSRFPETTVIAADTVVLLEDQLLGKPKSRREAFEMLMSLSGREHQVITSLTVGREGELCTGSERTLVFFEELSERRVRIYQEKSNPLDKAGGYTLEGAGELLVKRIEGCYSNVLGLPLGTLRRLLKTFGIDLWDHFPAS